MRTFYVLESPSDERECALRVRGGVAGGRKGPHFSSVGPASRAEAVLSEKIALWSGAMSPCLTA